MRGTVGFSSGLFTGASLLGLPLGRWKAWPANNLLGPSFTNRQSGQKDRVETSRCEKNNTVFEQKWLEPKWNLEPKWLSQVPGVEGRRLEVAAEG